VLTACAAVIGVGTRLHAVCLAQAWHGATDDPGARVRIRAPPPKAEAPGPGRPTDTAPAPAETCPGAETRLEKRRAGNASTPPPTLPSSRPGSRSSCHRERGAPARWKPSAPRNHAPTAKKGGGGDPNIGVPGRVQQPDAGASARRLPARPHSPARPNNGAAKPAGRPRHPPRP
jgi:hypothetical protein